MHQANLKKSTYLMLCYGYTHVFSYNSINKRSKNSHDMKLNTSYPLDQNEAEFHVKKQAFRNSNYASH
ncbi:hypothetical protein T4A_12212 [Trichinella pseudospiralis]|uniref:Uncharacterized protein n=1 Tax=Trichinella pseudospiralis TaxID=6337 RepID=A0A0V1EQ42_TRIPS|nr:hypothetical protein T4A_12212 [Trichinella pseudospiralis]